MQTMKKTVIWGLTALAGLELGLAQNPEAPQPPPPPQPPSVPKAAVPDGAPKEGGPKEGRRDPKPPMEKRTFLGVATAPLDPTVRTQLGIARGTGLNIAHVEKESPAGKALQEHDILTKFNDQILVSHDQLAVLVENAKPGESVNLTFLRGGKEQTAAVILAEHEVPVRGAGFPHMGGQPWMAPNPSWREAIERGEQQFREARQRMEETRERMENEAREMRRRFEGPAEGGRDRGRLPGEVEGRGPGREMRPPGVTVRHATWVENQLTLNLVENGEHRHLTVTDNGKEVFSGPVNTEDERARIPEAYREGFKKLEAQLKPQNRPDSGGSPEGGPAPKPQVF